MPEVLDKAFQLALQGDRTMLKLLLELHMSKSAPEQEKAAEKVEINITTRPSDTEIKESVADFNEVVKEHG